MSGRRRRSAASTRSARFRGGDRMRGYIYNDEDNVPMPADIFDRIDADGHNPTVYGSYAEMMAAEKEEAVPFSDPPPDGCWNCREFDGDRCMKEWNNSDEDYYLPDRDDRKPTDSCEDWEKDEDAVWEDYFDDDGPA